MTATYYVTLTDHGSERIAQAHGQAEIILVNLVLGDANGLPYDPISKKTRTSLVNQRASVPVQSVVVNGSIARVTATIDLSIGGFNIHELGLTDSTGKLVYIGNYHGGFKPVLANGASGELVLLIDIKADAGSQVLIQVDPTIVTANKQWVLDNFVKLTTYNAHVTQNQLEHNNLAALITAESQARAQADNQQSASLSQHIGQNQLEHNNLAALITAESQARAQADNQHEAAVNPHSQYILKTSINDTLSSNATDQVLSAKQGKVLNDKIDNIDFPDGVLVVDNLISDSATSALSARQGRAIANQSIYGEKGLTGSGSPGYGAAIRLDTYLSMDRTNLDYPIGTYVLVKAPDSGIDMNATFIIELLPTADRAIHGELYLNQYLGAAQLSGDWRARGSVRVAENGQTSCRVFLAQRVY